MSTRSRTLSRKALRRLLRDEPPDPDLRRVLLEAQLARPKRRADCEGGKRPCFWFGCRYHLAVEVTPAGGLKEAFPGRPLEDFEETCALDVAERGGVTVSPDFLGPPRIATGDLEDGGGGGGDSMPMIDDALSRFIQCPRFVALFPSGMPVRACLRRQVERKALKDDKGERVGWETVHEGCIGCPTGRETLKTSGAHARSCSTCGAGVVSLDAGAPCPECEDREGPCLSCGGAAKHKAGCAQVTSRSGFRRPSASASPSATGGGPRSTLIWQEGAVPDVPIGPPPATSKYSGYRPAGPTSMQTDPALAAKCERRRREEAAKEKGPPVVRGPLLSQRLDASEVASHATARGNPAHPPAHVAPVNAPPASPATEEAMAEKVCSNCKTKKLRSDNTSGICNDCRRAPAAGRARAGTGPAPAKVATAEKRRPSKRLREVAGDLEGKTLDELLDERARATARIEEIDEELHRRREAIDQALGKPGRTQEAA